jgi:subtilisin-like proprotein convertase family protein
VEKYSLRFLVDLRLLATLVSSLVNTTFDARGGRAAEGLFEVADTTSANVRRIAHMHRIGLALLGLLVAVGLWEPPVRAGSETSVVVRVPRGAAARVDGLGVAAERSIDYGSFVWMEISEEQRQDLVRARVPFQVVEGAHRIQVPGYQFDPLQDGPPQVPAGLESISGSGPGFRLIQLHGPVRDEWIQEMSGRQIKLLQYYPHNAYLVWSEETRTESAAGLSYVRWQGPFEPAYKFEEGVRERTGTIRNLDVMFYNDGQIAATLDAIRQLGGQVLRYYPSQPDKAFWNAIVQIDRPVLENVAQIPTVLWMGHESARPGLDDEMSDQIQAGNHPGGTPAPGYNSFLSTLGYNGSGVTWAVIDTGVDYNHPDLAPRIVGGYEFPGACNKPGQPGSDCANGGHGTHVAGIIGGTAAAAFTDASGFFYGLGVAPQHGIFAMNSLMGSAWPPAGGWQEHSKRAILGGAVGGNNSWHTGEAVPHGYQASERTHDLMVRDGNFDTASVAEPFINVFSAGNSGPGPQTISAPHEAKNIIAIASSRNFRVGSIDTLSSFSSRGPGLDGRIVPTLTAPGEQIASSANDEGGSCSTPIAGTSNLYAFCSGTSMAAPHASGAAVLVTQWWKATNGGQVPSPAMMKAVLVNSAVDMGTADIPNANEGWGRIHVGRAINPGVARHFQDQTRTFGATGEVETFGVAVADPSKPLKVTLVWTDAAGAAGANPALVNNLDLTVETNSTLYRGNVFAAGMSTTGGIADFRNNVESVYVASPGAGGAVITIAATAINGDGVPYNADVTDQDYALVCQNCVFSADAVLSVSRIGFGADQCSVTSSPAGINCGSGGNCSATFAPGSDVTLTAGGTTFVSWGGACTGTLPTCVVTVNGPTGVSAQCDLPPQTLTVTKSGTGTGTVVSAPAGIDCGGTCSATFTGGQTVNLTAVPNAGSKFSSWSGACTGTTPSCSVTMTAALSTNALFSACPAPVALTVGVARAGTLATTDCFSANRPGSYADRYTFSGTAGDPVEITMDGAPPLTDTYLYLFDPSGVMIAQDDDGGPGLNSRIPGASGFFTLPATGTYTIEATSFSPNITGSYSVAVRRPVITAKKTGNGAGTITMTPPGSTCGAGCTGLSATFTPGTSVTLTATPDSCGSRFAGWQGACTGTGACTLTVDAAKWAFAQFVSDVVLWDNGPVQTCATCGFGGAPASLIQPPLNILGYSQGAPSRVADDFTIPAGQTWNITALQSVGYQTGAPIGTSPYTGFNLRIWNGLPAAPGSTLVFGDTTTNRLTSSVFSGIYRGLDNQRALFNNNASAAVTLGPGTYWVDWQATTGGASPLFLPPVTIVDVVNTGNAYSSGNGTTYSQILDSAAGVTQGVPFKLIGSRVGVAPQVTVNGSTCPITVMQGAAVTVGVTGGPANTTDWVAKHQASAANETYFPDWKYLGGTQTPPPAGMSTASLPFTMPTAPGNYNFRFFANNDINLLATSPTVTVAAGPSLSINDVSVTEGNSGTTNASFTVTLSPAASGTVTVQVQTTPGTATSGTDYVAIAPTTLTFLAGETSKPVTVPVVGDLLAEGNETYFVDLSGVTGPAAITDNQGLGTIVDNEIPPVVACPATVIPGASFTATVNGGSSATDWIAQYAAGAPHSPPSLGWSYVALPRPQTKTLTASSTPGSYELRLFANDTFTVLGTCPFTVAPVPAFSINDVSVTEGNSGTVNANFTVTLSPAAGGTTTVVYQTAPGTATSGVDFGAVPPTTLTFLAGETSKTATVPVIGDLLTEGNETYFVNLSSATGGAVITDAQGLGTIIDNDVPPAVACPSIVAPGATFTVTFNGGNSGTDWTALYPAGAPHSPIPPGWSYVPMPRPQTRSMTAPNTPGSSYDVRLFANDTFTLIGQCTFTVQVVPTFSINDVTVTEGNTGTQNANFTVTLSPAAGVTTTVVYQTAPGTATSGVDYNAVPPTTLTFLAGETTKTAPVQVRGDFTIEPNETYFVNLSGATGGAVTGDAQGLGTIIDNDAPPAVSCPSAVAPGATFSATVNGGSSAMDWIAQYASGAPNSPLPMGWSYVSLPRPQTKTFVAPATLGTYELRLFANDTFTLIGTCPFMVAFVPTFSINDVTVTEGNTGTLNANFTVTLAGLPPGTTTVVYQTAPGTATSGTDFNAVPPTTLTFLAGETSKTATVQVRGDFAPEPSETYFVNLSSPTGGPVIGDGQGLGTITDNDGLTCPSVVAPNSTFTATVSVGSSATDWIALYGAAAPNSPLPSNWSYVALPRPQTKTFTAPGTAGSYQLRLFANDSFNLIATCPVQVEVVPTFSINDVTVTEGNTGTQNANFTVTLSPAALVTTTVVYQTAAGTATSGTDYNAVPPTMLTFLAGETSKPVTVQVRGDLAPEPSETYFVNLSTPTGGALIGDGQGLGTIQDNDALSCPAGVAPGATFTASVNGGSSPLDWIALYAAGAPNSPLPANWRYVPLPRPNTQTFTAPGSSGSFELRLFANDTFNLIATCPFTTLPTLSINDISVTEGNSGTANANFTVTLMPAAASTVTVSYQTAPGTATSGVDFLQVPPTTLTFNAGETSKSAAVAIVGDTVPEPNETFFVNLSGVTGLAAIGDGLGVGMILDDETALSINDVSVTEGNTGPVNATFTVTRTGGTSGTSSVSYATADGTALGLDFTFSGQWSNTTSISTGNGTAGSPYPSTIIMPSQPGLIAKVLVTLRDFTHTWPNDVDVLLVSPTGQKVLLMSDVGGGGPGITAPVTITLRDDASLTLPNSAFASGAYRPTNLDTTSDVFPGPAPGAPYATQMSAFNGQNPAGAWSLYVRDDVGVDTGSFAGGWSLQIFTAGDYIPITVGTVTFGPGDITKTVAVPIRPDIAFESDETFFVNLFSPVGAAITDNQGVGTIVNDDCAADTDSDGLCDSVETNTGIYVSPTNTGTSPTNPDTDGDALKDGWEVLGKNGINLLALGASPVHKDIFVEMDYMVRASAANGLGPNSTVINGIVASFAAAPVSNPDGSTGINIHCELGNEVPYDADLNPYATEIAAIKAAHFNAQKAPVYHYMIWADGYNGGGSSGVSLGIPATDFIVTLGTWNSGNGGTNGQKIGTFIHELGHNLGLTHGGNDHNNYKPNYLSVMSYNFQTSGVYRNGTTFYDYQRFALPSLNEAALDENVGLNGGGAVATYRTIKRCPGGSSQLVNADSSIDWNCNALFTDNPVSVDINGDTLTNTLGTQDNWASIVWNGGGPIGSGVDPERLVEQIRDSYPQVPMEELTEEMDRQIHDSLRGR